MLIEPSRDPAAGRGDGLRLPATARPVVLFACDFSPVSAAALEAAQAVAEAFGGEVAALHVVPTTMPSRGGLHALASPALLRPDLTDDVRRGLEGILQPVRAARIPAEVLVREGRPADEILDAAESLGASLIVVGTHGRRAIDRAFVGSMAEAVLRGAKRPVLAVPPVFRKSPGPPWPRRVLAASDLSPDATAALACASAIAAKTGAPLVAAHVLDRNGAYPRHRRAAAERRLRQDAGPRAQVEAVAASSSVAADILSVAARRSADLIVVGASGRRRLGRILFGSTAMGVVRGATCPVLVVHHP